MDRLINNCMQYFSANTSSGRIHCHFENLTDDNIETFGDWNIANTEFHVVRVADGDELTSKAQIETERSGHTSGRLCTKKKLKWLQRVLMQA